MKILKLTAVWSIMLILLTGCGNPESLSESASEDSALQSMTVSEVQGLETSTLDTEVTATEPPATEPPVTEPPVTEPPATEPPVTEPPVTEPPAPKINEITYMLNTNTMKFHHSGCSEIKKMDEENKQLYTGTREDVIAMGYDPCGRCNP